MNFHKSVKVHSRDGYSHLSMPAVPTPQKAAWTAEGQEKRETVQRMFADIAPTYDFCNSLMSLRLHRRWRSVAVGKLNLALGDTVADICCGTGDFFVPLRRAIGEQGRMVGIDFCLPMLERAEIKDSATMRALGDGCRLPLASESVDAVSVGWGIRNVPDIDGAHREIFRVLKSGGRFVSLDMARPRNGILRAVSELVTVRLLPLLGGFFGKKEAYTYLPKSAQRFKSREELRASMQAAGLVDVEYRDLFFGNICIHSGTKP